MTALLIVGSAPCVQADLAEAKRLFPDHEVMLVNGACTIVEEAGHMLAGHTDKAEEFYSARIRKFPDRPIRVHANAASENTPRECFPSVTDWHTGTSSGATSAGKAARIGLHMGFAPIVLCGCPMDGSGYAETEAVVSQHPWCQRVGDEKMQNRATIRRYRDRMAELAETEFKGKVFSMSGFTRDVLGYPS